MEIFHVTVAHPNRLTLFPRKELRLGAVRRLVRAAGVRLLFFCIADDHIHLVLQGTRKEVGHVVMAIALSLNPLVGARLSPGFYKPVTSRVHLRRLLPYILDQTSHHEIRLAAHPALWEGSSFPDLVGARHIGFDTRPLVEALPRLALSDVFGAVGLPVLQPAPADVPVHHLAAAVDRACTWPLASRSSRHARRAAVQLATACGWSVEQLTSFRRCRKTLRRDLLQRPDPAWQHAVGLQLALAREAPP